MNEYYKKVCRQLKGIIKPTEVEVERFFQEGKTVHEAAYLIAFLAGKILSSDVSELPFED